MPKIRSLIPEQFKIRYQSIGDFASASGWKYEVCWRLVRKANLPTCKHMLVLCKLWNVQPGDLLVYEP